MLRKLVMNRRVLFGSVLTTLLVLFSSGCGSTPTGVVSGKVTVNGKPMTRGLISFLSDAGNKDAFSAAIINGEYKTEPIPVGHTKIYISVVTPPPGQGMGAGGGEPQNQNMNTTGAIDQRPSGPMKAKDPTTVIDTKYNDASTSGLTFDVKAGENKFDVELK